MASHAKFPLNLGLTAIIVEPILAGKSARDPSGICPPKPGGPESAVVNRYRVERAAIPAMSAMPRKRKKARYPSSFPRSSLLKGGTVPVRPCSTLAPWHRGWRNHLASPYERPVPTSATSGMSKPHEGGRTISACIIFLASLSSSSGTMNTSSS